MAIAQILLLHEATETRDSLGVRKLDHAFPYNDPDFPCLKYLDPYGLAFFNRRQMNEVIPEWDRLADRLRTDEERAIHQQARELFVRCRDGVYLYICFDGD